MKLPLEITIASLSGLSLISPLGGPIAIAASLASVTALATLHAILYGIDS